MGSMSLGFTRKIDSSSCEDSQDEELLFSDSHRHRFGLDKQDLLGGSIQLYLDSQDA